MVGRTEFWSQEAIKLNPSYTFIREYQYSRQAVQLNPSFTFSERKEENIADLYREGLPAWERGNEKDRNGRRRESRLAAEAIQFRERKSGKRRSERWTEMEGQESLCWPHQGPLS